MHKLHSHSSSACSLSSPFPFSFKFWEISLHSASDKVHPLWGVCVRRSKKGNQSVISGRYCGSDRIDLVARGYFPRSNKTSADISFWGEILLCPLHPAQSQTQKFVSKQSLNELSKIEWFRNIGPLSESQSLCHIISQNTPHSFFSFPSRPCSRDQHAPGHLRATETSRHHPLPGGCQPTCDVSEVGERRISPQSGKGECDTSRSGRSMPLNQDEGTSN